MCEQALFYIRQTQETAMDTDGYVWSRNNTIPSMDQTNEACTKQESKEITTDISNVERSRPRDIRQSDIRQRTRGTDGGTWHRQINAHTVARSLPKNVHYKYICASPRGDICKEMKNG
jgi:phosphoserine aminotransferase